MTIMEIVWITIDECDQLQLQTSFIILLGLNEKHKYHIYNIYLQIAI